MINSNARRALQRTTQGRRRRQTKEHLETRRGVRNRGQQESQVQLAKMEAAAQDRTGWKTVSCSLRSTGNDKTSPVSQVGVS